MAETRMGSVISRTKSDVMAMKETLCAQQQLLQRLYMELDEEREAAATAASEVLDMILRLQGEKAVVEMEASQYKRMAEEKIGHVEASLEAFEELMYQKEMEIATLKLQVHALKHKLVSFGCDLELEFQEDLLLNRRDQRNGENGGQDSILRRLYSLPPIQYKTFLRAAARKSERSSNPVLEVEDNTGMEVAPPSVDLTRKTSDNGTLDSYLNQITMLNEQVRVISDCTEGEEKSGNLRGRRGRSSSSFAQATYRQTDEVSSGEIAHDGEAIIDNSPCSCNVLDVFEVPQTGEKHEVSEHMEKLDKRNQNAESRLTKPDPMDEGMVESFVKHGAEKKKGVLKAHSEIKTLWPKDIMTILGLRKEGTSVDCNSQAEFQKLNQRIERLERERICARQEISHEGNGKEQLSLLKDIQSQLNLIQSEVRGWKPKKANPVDDVSLVSLQEAMLHFWL